MRLPAREKARQDSCASNLKQLTNAAMMYTQDYDGGFPPKPTPDGDWMAWHWSTRDDSCHLASPNGGPLYDYAKNFCICWCPSDHADETKDFRAHPRSSYLWNNTLCGRHLSECEGQPLLWDREPWHQGRRNLARTDQTVQCLQEVDFQRQTAGRGPRTGELIR